MWDSVSLTITQQVHQELLAHLFPGDDLEAVAFIRCTRQQVEGRVRLLGHTVWSIDHDLCIERGPHQVTWPTSGIEALLALASRKGESLVKVHSHPGGYEDFSEWDNRADKELFPGLHAWMDLDSPHASAVMLPDGSMFGRAVDACGAFSSLRHINVAGDDLLFWPASPSAGDEEFSRRVRQTYGKGTYEALRQLRVAVIGASGTGSPVVNYLARNCVGHLVLVDPDRVEEKNLNRLTNATMEDAKSAVFKVDVLARAISEMDMRTTVEVYRSDLLDPAAVRAVASCDIVFGCVDTAFGRHMINRISAFYLIPYIDVGVKLVADGSGGIEQIWGTVHFVKPGGSSLLSRGVYDLEQVRAEEMRRTNPKAYEEERQAGYLAEVGEERPAVATVNGRAAADAVEELLARLHGYRNEDNSLYAIRRFNLTDVMHINEPHGKGCEYFTRLVARGDTDLLLGMPHLDDGSEAA